MSVLGLISSVILKVRPRGLRTARVTIRCLWVTLGWVPITVLLIRVLILRRLWSVIDWFSQGLCLPCILFLIAIIVGVSILVPVSPESRLRAISSLLRHIILQMSILTSPWVGVGHLRVSLGVVVPRRRLIGGMRVVCHDRIISQLCLLRAAQKSIQASRLCVKVSIDLG